MATITGTIDPDRLGGGEDADVIAGLAGDDQIDGGGGKDRIESGDGRDIVNGGDGDDYILGGRDDDQLEGGAGNDLLQAGAGADQLIGGDGDDQLYGADGRDSLRGRNGNDRLWGGGGNDNLQGGDGDDRLTGGAGQDSFEFGVDLTSDDSASDARSIGTNAILDYRRGEDALTIRIAFDGADFIETREISFNEVDSNQNGILDDSDVFVAVRQETLDGVAKLSTVIDVAGLLDIGQAFTQTITVHGVTGLDAQDFAPIGVPNEELIGSEAGDVLVGTGLNDPILGRGGNDYLRGLAGNDTLLGESGNDVLDGGRGDDYLVGAEGADLLRGGAGDDRLFGDQDGEVTDPLAESADDRLFGDAGDDYLLGGFGKDILTGGDGRDTFAARGFGVRLDDGSMPTVDTLITDFVRGEDQLDDALISFDKYDFNGDGQIKGSDAYVTLKQVTYNDETKLSLVINLRADDATVASGKITLFGVLGLDAADFAGRALPEA